MNSVSAGDCNVISISSTLYKCYDKRLGGRGSRVPSVCGILPSYCYTTIGMKENVHAVLLLGKVNILHNSLLFFKCT